MADNIVMGQVTFGPTPGASQNAVNVLRDWKVEQATCQKCHQRPATETWSEGSIAFIHGMYQRWCKPCVLMFQLEHARKMAAQIPELEAAIALLLRDGPTGEPGASGDVSVQP